MRFPRTRRKLAENDPYAGAVVGGQISADVSRNGVVDDGNIAWPERVDQARRSWMEASLEDFEPLDSRGRFWRDKATGREYKALSGAPLLSLATEATRGISAFLVWGQRLVFLRPADYPEVLTGPIGHVYGGQVGPRSTPIGENALRIL